MRRRRGSGRNDDGRAAASARYDHCEEGSLTAADRADVDWQRRLPERGRSEIFQGDPRQGAHAHLRRSVQCQQGLQRQWRHEVDREGRRLLLRVQQAPEGRGVSRYTGPDQSGPDPTNENWMKRITRDIVLKALSVVCLAVSPALAGGAQGLRVAQAQAPAPAASPPAPSSGPAAKDATDKPATEKGPAKKSALSIPACSVRYLEMKVEGKLNGRKWVDFRRDECGAKDTTAVFPNGIG